MPKEDVTKKIIKIAKGLDKIVQTAKPLIQELKEIINQDPDKKDENNG